MTGKPNNAAITAGLLLVIFLWGGNNTGSKWLVSPEMGGWPPIGTGGSRFLLAGLLLLAVMRGTRWLGRFTPLTRDLWHALWLRGGLTLAIYVVVFCWALKLTSASHVALYLGASPVWALLMEERPRWNAASLRRYAAALLALTGVVVLFWPALKSGHTSLAGEALGLGAGLLWANYSRQARMLSQRLSGVEVAAHSMWMSGVWLLLPTLWEAARHELTMDFRHAGVQGFCIVFGSVIPYALWNSALRHWRTSRVMLFNNFVPLSTSVWAHFALGEPITATFCTAMVLIIAGVLLGQMDWTKIFKLPEGF